MPPRRPASAALIVSLAAVGALVAGAAGTGAYLGLSEYLHNRTVAGGPGPGGPTTATRAPTTTTAAAQPCPDYTIAAVRAKGGPGALVTVIYVKGALAGVASAEAWICRDSDDTLYYQGHELAGGTPTAATSQYTILLGGLVRGTVVQEGGVYNAYSNGRSGFHYEVSRTTFAKVQADGSRSDYQLLPIGP
jgi:hypothetical protein